MKKLAIISSYHEPCGIANYTERLEPVLRSYYDVTVLPLNTEVLKSATKELVTLGDNLIHEIALKLPQFDMVNIQFEVGLFGTTPKMVLRRLNMLLQQTSNLIFTFHSVNFKMPSLSKSALLSFRCIKVIKQYLDARKWPQFYDTLTKRIIAMDHMPNKKANIVVHDTKSQLFIKRVYHFEHIYSHPLGLSNAAERAIRPSAEEKSQFKQMYHIASNAKMVGVFGFVSEYKGHLVALSALRHLPKNYHLLIFGEQHPAGIQPFLPVDQYLGKMLDYMETCNAEDLKQKAKQSKGEVEEVNIIQQNSNQFIEFSKRVHFYGNVDDDAFAKAMRCCDCVILPYMEVNQMGSGIAALTIENHAKAIFANTKCFHDLKDKFPNCFETFDIGNYFQLAEIIENFPDIHDSAIDEALKIHNLEANVAEYVSIFERK